MITELAANPRASARMVEAEIRICLAALPKGDQLTSTELVERIAAPDMVDAVHKIAYRIGKALPRLYRTIEGVGKGPQKGKIIKRRLWLSLASAAVPEGVHASRRMSGQDHTHTEGPASYVTRLDTIQASVDRIEALLTKETAK